MDKPEIKCPICEEQFVQRRRDMTFCSKRCANISANRAARSRAGCVEKKARVRVRDADLKMNCPYNEAINCYMRKCSTCGWNPEVAKMRLEALHG